MFALGRAYEAWSLIARFPLATDNALCNVKLPINLAPFVYRSLPGEAAYLGTLAAPRLNAGNFPYGWVVEPDS